jgi:hypothetical protein
MLSSSSSSSCASLVSVSSDSMSSLAAIASNATTATAATAATAAAAADSSTCAWQSDCKVRRGGNEKHVDLPPQPLQQCSGCDAALLHAVCDSGVWITDLSLPVPVALCPSCQVMIMSMAYHVETDRLIDVVISFSRRPAQACPQREKHNHSSHKLGARNSILSTHMVWC